MLYHLIQLNPNRDITLHVSANNPAMVRPSTLPLFSRFVRVMLMSFSGSCCTTASASKQRSLSQGSTKTTLTRNQGRRRMHFGYGSGDKP